MMLVGCPKQSKYPIAKVQPTGSENQALVPEDQPPMSNLGSSEDHAREKINPDKANESAKGKEKPKQSYEPIKSTVMPDQPNWNRRSREIARTELSPITEQSDDKKALKTSELDNVIPLPLTTPILAIDETYLSQNPIETASEQMIRQKPEASIETLDSINLDNLSETERADVFRIKSQALRQMNMPIEALRFEAERLKYLINPALNAATRRILGELETLKDSLLIDLSLESNQLAGLASAIRIKASQEPEDISDWLRKYREHPLLKANLPNYRFLIQFELQSAFRITVLLPLTGDLANAGRAIRDGILFEYQRRKSEVDLNLQIIDTAKLTLSELIEFGQLQESEFLIGPLQKDRVTTLLKSKPKTPVLALNRVKISDMQIENPAYSLSLSIEDDAESAVEQIARIVERPRIITFHSNSPLGLRAADAISQRLAKIGGSNGGQFVLDVKKPETAIAKAFGVSDSQNRRRDLANIVGLRLQHTPRIRQDMSSIVIQTNPTKVQQIRPLLDFYYLQETPVFIIGAYQNDLNEIVEDLRNSNLLLTPWDLGTKAKTALEQRPLSQGILGSLVAIGIDALDMTLRLGFGEPPFSQGQTGYLSLGNDLMIHRQLSKIEVSKDKMVTPIIWQPIPTSPPLDISNGQ